MKTAVSCCRLRLMTIYEVTKMNIKRVLRNPASVVTQGPGQRFHQWIVELPLLSGVFACCLPSCPELRRCSPRSQPNTLSRRMPLCFSFCLVGLDFMKERKKVISFPCFLDTEEGDKKGRTHLKSPLCVCVCVCVSGGGLLYSKRGFHTGSAFTQHPSEQCSLE